ncbi:MAG: hypothetical protein F6J95_025405 [Leptolyngbya sp. SIO1E4]|nr:hypothetical protein [Leptolyngbya sp. SIO1E4]
MKINDLNHLSTLSEDAPIMGGGRKKRRRQPRAKAFADAKATAIGFRTYSDTITNAEAVAGLFSSSSSSSYAESRGLPVA